jgi:cellulose synthase/poly-beta-1,6-N-acetylglucosamine synthase-like glycosyltransferase
METLIFFFFLFLFIVFYTFIGYGLILWLLTKIIPYKPDKPGNEKNNLPEITLLVPAYNEKNYVAEKVKNSLSLNYPKEKLQLMWITDGSNDGTSDLLKTFPDIIVLHNPERKGKINAIHRAMEYVNTPIVVFSDANTTLSQDSVMIIADIFRDSSIGCVAGEKRIRKKESDNAAGSGEGLYWKYESALKILDAKLYSATGAAGELFAIRTHLYQQVEPDTILDDFLISLKIVMKGFRIGYNPQAYAEEKPSASLSDEFMRKTRIAAGGIQSISRLLPLLNVFKYGLFSFQYISHRVLRWTITPYCLILIFVFNALLLKYSLFFNLVFILQVIFYLFALLGYILENMHIRNKILFVPFYFVFMNWAVIVGQFKFFGKKQNAAWKKVNRAVD